MEWVLWPPGRVYHFLYLRSTIIQYFSVSLELQCCPTGKTVLLWMRVCRLSWSLFRSKISCARLAFHLVIHGLACWYMFCSYLIHCNAMSYSEIYCSSFQICNLFLKSTLTHACFCQNSKWILKRRQYSSHIWNISDFLSTYLSYIWVVTSIC